MVVATDRRMTLQEFLEFDDGSDGRFELVDGVLVEMANECTINTQIAVFLIGFFIQLGLPIDEIGVKQLIEVVSEFSSARDPDLIIHTNDSVMAIDGRREACLFLGEPNPRVVIEIVSPGTSSSLNYKRDYEQKPGEYAGRGIPEMWQIDVVREWVRVGSLIDGEYQFKTYVDEDGIVSSLFSVSDLTAAQILTAGKRTMKKSQKGRNI